MKTIITYLSENYPTVAFFVLVIGIAVWIGWWANKFYSKVVKTEGEVLSVKAAMQTEFAKTDEKINTVKAAIQNEFAKTDEKIIAVKAAMQTEFAKIDEKMQAEFAKTDEKIIAVKTDLKENDLHHLGKAMLLMATELLKNNPERFERVKDTILETTPENRRDEIKSITLL